MKLNKSKPIPIIALAVSAIVIAFAFQIISPDFSQRGDTLTQYDPIARSLADGRGFWNNGAPTARVPPGYPFLLSIIYKFGGGYEVIFILQVFLLAGIGTISYFIAKKFLPWPFNFLSALNIAVWPYLVLYTKLILTEILFIFLFMAAVYAMLELLKKQNYKWAVMAGGLLATATLVRPVILLSPFWLLGSLVIFSLAGRANSQKFNFFSLRLNFFPSLGLLAAALTAFILVLTPWTIRNYIQFNAFIPVTSGLQYSINRGYQTLDYTNNTPALKPGEVTIKDNIIARLKNIYLFWNPGAGGSNAQLLLNQNKLFGVAFVIYKVIFILTVILAFLPFMFKFMRPKLTFEPFSKNRLLFLSIIIYFWAMHIMLYPYPRYTLPIMPLVIILAWTSVHFLWRKFRTAQYYP